ncbi:hypothetical protein GP486_001029 [Trichoglossum hirsutum]|uniref:Uncharacterized protein n=1 Tax=Trichoglossum hirsutum TaxID=265104 RepID=A0A9P8LHY0_9PEZI|nr:hypothetical protein GP486_001029 [Trichoglossum hirsutum]
MLPTPNATESMGVELQPLGIQRNKGVDFGAFSPMAEFAAVAAGRELRVFSWDRRADLRWTLCWAETVLQECMKASERMVTISMSESLVAVAAEGGFEVYELNTPEDEGPRDPTMPRRKKEPVIRVIDARELRTIALSPDIPETSGRICAGTGYGELLIWDIQRGEDGQYVLTPHSPHKLSLERRDKTLDLPSAVAFSHDSSRICVGSTSRNIYIYTLGEDSWSLIKHLEGNFVSGHLLVLHRTN